MIESTAKPGFIWWSLWSAITEPLYGYLEDVVSVRPFSLVFQQNRHVSRIDLRHTATGKFQQLSQQQRKQENTVIKKSNRSKLEKQHTFFCLQKKILSFKIFSSTTLATVATIAELFQWLLQPYRNQPSAVDGVLVKGMHMTCANRHAWLCCHNLEIKWYLSVALHTLIDHSKDFLLLKSRKHSFSPNDHTQRYNS